MTTSIEQRLSELPPLTAGQHHSLYDGVCAMEAAAYLAGEEWTDHPECVCPTIGDFLRTWNDDLPDADRDRLIRPLIPRIIGSRSTRAVEERRSWMALDWLIREHAPVWLALSPGLAAHAERLRTLAEVRDVETVGAAQPVLTAASDAARDAWVKARDAASDAASDTASTVAMAAASDAVWDAARAAASDTASDAWAAARDAARAVASDAAARAVASDAAVSDAAARAVASDAAVSDAARVAARAALAPTVATQQQSALRLIDRMLAVTEEATTC